MTDNRTRSIADVSNRGFLESGDLDEILVTLNAIGDPAWTWFLPTEHGTPEQRSSAFALGFAGGAGTCTAWSFVNLFPVSEGDEG
jgi:predicted metalloprotease